VWRRVMATYARVDIPNQLAALGDMDAALQDSKCGTLIQLAINRGERLCLSGNASCLGTIRG
jgi:hypothetical protein